MLRYKINVLQELKNTGYNTMFLRTNKLLGENCIQYLREGKIVGTKALDSICKMLKLQPGDILEYIEEE